MKTVIFFVTMFVDDTLKQNKLNLVANSSLTMRNKNPLHKLMKSHSSPHSSSRALLVPSGALITLKQRGEKYSPDKVAARFTERHGLPKLKEQGWNLAKYTPGVYQFYRIQRYTTANEILASLHGIGVAYLPGSLLALIHKGAITNMPVVAFLSVVRGSMPLRRMLYVAADSESGSDQAMPDKLMITGYMNSNPECTLYQPGPHVLVCCERF